MRLFGLCMLFLIWMKALEAEPGARVRKGVMIRWPSWESFFPPILFILIIELLMAAEKRFMADGKQEGLAGVARLGAPLKSWPVFFHSL